MPSVEQFRAAGFTATEQKAGNPGLTAPRLITAGYTPMELKMAGFTLGELTGQSNYASIGLSWAELREIGFTVTEFIEAGYTDNLQEAGFTISELKESGFT